MILYLNSKYSKMSGGYVVNERNFNFVKYVFNDKNVLLYNIDNINFKKDLLLEVKLFFKKQKKINYELFNFISQNDINLIFISNSLYGRLVKDLKLHFPQIKIYVFFHNVEYIYHKQLYKKSNKLKHKLLCFYIKLIEKKSYTYGDLNITLNHRDTKLLEKLYGNKAKFVFPTTLDPISKTTENQLLNNELNLLFVGSSFFANINGIKWFLENVLPSLSRVKLTIVGKDIKSELIRYQNSHVFIYENVDNLTQFYENANVVILPIFEGSGMKTKTAEALKYYKPILATKESLEGYEGLEIHKVGFKCDNADEFINAIDSILNNPESLNKFSLNSKKYFDNFLNSEIVYKNFKGEFLKLFNT